ncbi:hypothetical protein PENSTE_c013G01089 [Penicillium steckii]|uniref:Major facilitator superfamily (MFS) profile domain-containing protein n=1 Tax=Penicillium steckii TaxID=303698 RepID=A0A1V6T300_9EURO|nr:hypothetical protein PENSTE_c013G01089 [Penicillium steckii]
MAELKENTDTTEVHGSTTSDIPKDASPTKKDLRFWLIFLAIGMTTFLAALDTSIISTALPTIASDLGSEELYVWVVNTYLLTSTVFSAVFGQASNIFGRRLMTATAVVIFAVGSAVAGAANSTGMILAGRAVQGVGGGGISTMSEVVICDMVSLRERGVYAGIIGAVWAIAAVVGPIIGGGFAQNVTWRWIFYLNLPISGVALVLILTLLNLRNPRKSNSVRDRVLSVDWIGNTLLTLGITSILLSLTWAGTTHPWSSWRTIVPLVLGFVGLGGFLAYEAAPWVKEPTMPIRLFANRSAGALFAISFVHSMLLFWICYFLPIYFQAVRDASPTRSAVMLLPIATTTAPAGILAGGMITKTGKYRFWHFSGFILMTLACGLFTLLDETTSTGQWTGFQILFGVGTGVVFTSVLPPILACLDESDVATATATWTFLRNFGSIWGTAIPSAVFNTRANHLLSTIDSEQARALLENGGAYERATKAFMRIFQSNPSLLASIKNLYVLSLKEVWQVSIAFGGLGFLLAFLVRSYTLRDDLNTEYGLKTEEESSSDLQNSTKSV